jgi:GxxExxY protein
MKINLDSKEKQLNTLSNEVIGAAIRVHSALGPGILESAYEACLAYELRQRNLQIESQVSLPIIYYGQRIDAGYRIDLLVENSLIIELKAVEAVNKIHKTQLLSYLKLSDLRLGLLFNFNVTRLKEGIYRIVNKF